EVHLPYRPRVRADGTAEVPVRRLTGLVEKSIDQILGKAHGRALAGVGISSFWHSLLAVEENGEPLTPVYLWSDTRSWQAARALGTTECGLRARFTKRWPALANVPWVLAAGDGALANLGSGCVDPARRALTVGTSGALRVITERRPQRLPTGIWCYRLDGRRFV